MAPAAGGFTLSEPLVAFEPVHEPVALHVVELVAVHVITAAVPNFTCTGVAAIVRAGAGGGGSSRPWHDESAARAASIEIDAMNVARLRSRPKIRLPIVSNYSRHVEYARTLVIRAA